MVAEWFLEFCERNDFIFNSFRNFKPVKRFQNRSDVWNFGAWMFFGDDLFDILEDRSTESCSSQTWRVR